MADDDTAERRREQRSALVADCELVSGATPFKAQLLDLASQGCRFTCDEPLNPGDRVTLRLHDEFAPVEAQVVWCRNLTHGAQFAAPLEAELMDTLTALSALYGDRLATQIRDDE